MCRAVLFTLTILMIASAAASAGDSWFRVCRPLKDYCHPRCDECAGVKIRWAMREIRRAPEPCVKKQFNLKAACDAYREGLRTVLEAPKVCCRLKHDCAEAVHAYRDAAEELCQCSECERR